MASNPMNNFRILWEAEDELIGWAELIVAGTPHLQDHLESIETYMSCVFTLREATPKNSDREYALSALFLRTFDTTNHAVRTLHSGNYIGAVMYCRDLIETAFLIDYLLEEPSLATSWLYGSVEDHKKKFSPRNIREALDKRDGFEGKKRMERYNLLSNLGAHPTPQSLELKKDGTKLLNTGPFKHRDLLKETLEEIARAVLGLAIVLRRYRQELPKGESDTSALSLMIQKNYEVFFGGRK